MTTRRGSMRLVQLRRDAGRGVARVDEPRLRVLSGFESTFALATAAIASGRPLTRLVEEHCDGESLDYDAVYESRSDWRLLPPIDHPEPARCLVSGTGLTHLGSAASRNAMHGKSDDELTDSMRMFRAGLEGGRPQPGQCGTAPEWFYKGTGDILRACGEPLVVPGYAEDGGEEAEIAGIYVIDPERRPRRIGMTGGNEFSDHVFEKRNYLNLAGSKLRNCAIGPELVIDPEFDFVPGRVTITRAGDVIWDCAIATGDREMCHSLANLEHHHFKFEGHRRPGDVHVHFFGAPSLSFSSHVRLRAGDLMTVQFQGFGRPLRNTLTAAAECRDVIAAEPVG
jgi:hypothetical protein